MLGGSGLTFYVFYAGESKQIGVVEEELSMKRATLIFFLVAVTSVLLLAACSLEDLPFMPAEATSDPEMMETIEEIGQILTEMPTSEPVSSPTTAPTLPPVNTQTAEPTAIPENTITSVPTGEPTPTRTPTTVLTKTWGPTSTRTLTPTMQTTPTKIPTSFYQTDPRAELGEPDWSDPMDDGNNWPGSADKYTDIYFGDSTMALVGVSEAVGWRMPKTEIYKDFYAEMVVSSGDCKAGDAYGMIFRVPELETPDAGYLFEVNCEGAYTLKRWNGAIGSGLQLPMIHWKYTDALYTGPNQVNRLGVKAEGRRISLYINGARVNIIHDANYPQGYIGVFVNRYKTERYTIFVDELSVWRNP
jgi:hypothetical protein